MATNSASAAGRGEVALGRAVRFAQLDLHVDQGLQGPVAEKDRFNHIVFAHHVGAALDHHDTGLGPGHDDVDVAEVQFRDGGVDSELAVDSGDAHGGDRPGEGDVRKVQRGGSTDHGQGVRVVFLIHGQDRGNHLGFKAVALREQGPHGPVDQPRGQGFLFAGSPDFTAKVVARDSPGRVDLLLVFHRQRHKVAGSRVMGGHHGHQHHRVAVLDHHGPGGLLGHLAGLDAQGFTADLFLQ